MAIVRDVMNQRVLGVRPDARLAEAIDILAELQVEVAPVVASDGTVVGIISESALIDVVFDSAVKHDLVRQHMNPDVHVAHPDDPLSRLAELFALYSFQSLPVVEEGKFTGLVRRRDLINYVLRTGEVLTDPLTELISPLAPIT